MRNLKKFTVAWNPSYTEKWSRFVQDKTFIVLKLAIISKCYNMGKNGQKDEKTYETLKIQTLEPCIPTE